MSRFTSFALSAIILAIGWLRADAQQPLDKSAKAEDKDPTLIRRIAVGNDVYVAYWSGSGKIMVTGSGRKRKDEKDIESPKFITTKLWDAQSGKMLQSLGELNVPGYHYRDVSYDGSTLLIRETSPRLITKELEIWDIGR